VKGVKFQYWKLSKIAEEKHYSPERKREAFQPVLVRTNRKKEEGARDGKMDRTS
jgi:hypothetical protein